MDKKQTGAEYLTDSQKKRLAELRKKSFLSIGENLLKSKYEAMFLVGRDGQSEALERLKGEIKQAEEALGIKS